MTLQRRLLRYLLVCAPLVWLLATGLSLRTARHEVDELFDTELIRLSREVSALLVTPWPNLSTPPAAAASGPATVSPVGIARLPAGAGGAADEDDLAIAVWDREGRVRVADREGILLPYRPDAAGFVDLQIGGNAWRLYYLPAAAGDWRVAAGQRVHERHELLFDLIASQGLPWLGMLPVLLLGMAWAVRRALLPVRELARDIGARDAAELAPLPEAAVPAELRPMVAAMNGLFGRIEQTLARERHFTADAAHELRTPLAVLRAQWDVVRHAAAGSERAHAERRLDDGFERMDRLVAQLLALSRVEDAAGAGGAGLAHRPIDWVPIVERVASDCLALAERRGVELACEWEGDGGEGDGGEGDGGEGDGGDGRGRECRVGESGARSGGDDENGGWRGGPAPAPDTPAFLGDEALLTVLLRNLVDNAMRYAPPGSTVMLRIGHAGLSVENDGPVLPPQQVERLGERFYRPDGQAEGGSGLGLSIVRRIAALHGMRLAIQARDGGGLRVGLAFPQAAPSPTGLPTA